MKRNPLFMNPFTFKLLKLLFYDYKLSTMCCYASILLLGLDGVITQILNTPLEKFHIQARRPVMLANSVLVENIPMERCSKDWLDMYFTNKSKSGIESYKEIDILSNQKVVLHLKT